MRSSPWPSLAITLTLMAAACWAILEITKPNQPPPASAQAQPKASTETSSNNLAYLSLKASKGLVSLSLEEPASAWSQTFSLAQETLDAEGELTHEELLLPFAGEIELFVEARWQNAAPGQALALELELEPANSLRSQSQTFWTTAEPTGTAQLRNETWQLTLPQ